MTPPTSHIAHILDHPHNACQRGCEVHVTHMQLLYTFIYDKHMVNTVAICIVANSDKNCDALVPGEKKKICIYVNMFSVTGFILDENSEGDTYYL